MKNYRLTSIAMLFAAGMIFTACTKDVEENKIDGAQPEITTRTATGPKVMVYYEINDTNPLNALCFEMNGAKFIDIAQLFASNIHKDAAGYPTLYFNDKMAPMFADVNTYVKPLQDAGIKVCLTVLGDWQKIGVANLNADQADRFADILTYVVEHYNLDGIGFDDEYSDYASTVSGSYSRIIKALRAKLDAKFGVGAKLITVFQWGNYGQIDAAAGAMIDYADHGTFSPYYFATNSNISGMTKDRWMPMAINMGSNWSSAATTIQTNAGKVKNQSYGGMMMFNVRRHTEVNPLPVFQAMANGAFGGATVSIVETDYSRNWTPDPNGYTITKEMSGTYLPKYTE